MSQSRHEGDIWILRIHDQATDGMRIGKPNEFPSLTGVDGFIDSVPANDVAADASLSGTDIDDVGIRSETARAPIEGDASFCLSKRGFQLSPPSVVFQTPPATPPK